MNKNSHLDRYFALKNNIEPHLEDSTYLIAIDEVGRGSLFGPVSVGGVIYPVSELEKSKKNLWKSEWESKVRDSKKIKEPLRKTLSQNIKETYLTHVSHIGVRFINRHNINRAIQYGLYRTVQRLMNNLGKVRKDFQVASVVVDGNYRFDFPQIRMQKPMPPLLPVIKGDEHIFHVSCASIIAKVERDELIKKSSLRFSGYGLEKNCGYGTAQHREAIQKIGITRFHRKEFIKKIVNL